MIELYQNYLVKQLKDAGIKHDVYKTMKDLETFTGIHIGAVIIDSDKLEEAKQSSVYLSNGVKVRRIKKYSRITSLNVIIGEHSVDRCDEIFTKFLSCIDPGIYDADGNYVDIKLGTAGWISDKDSILKSTVAVQLPVVFHGGIYKDALFKQVEPVVRLENDEEDYDYELK